MKFFEKRKLREELKTGDPYKQVKAAENLAELGDSSVIPILIKHLHKIPDFTPSPEEKEQRHALGLQNWAAAQAADEREREQRKQDINKQTCAECGVTGLFYLARSGSNEALTHLVQAAKSMENPYVLTMIVGYLYRGLGLPPATMLELCPEPYCKYMIRNANREERDEDDHTMRSMAADFLPVLRRLYAKYPIEKGVDRYAVKGGVMISNTNHFWTSYQLSSFISTLDVPERGSQSRTTQRCPNCSPVFPAGDQTCPSCGSGGEYDPVQPLESPFEVDGLVTGSDLPKDVWAPGKGSLPAGSHVGRNDPCPCGSGRRYKKCHGSYHVQ